MKKAPRRTSSKLSKKSSKPTRRATPKAAAKKKLSLETVPADAAQLEQISKRYAQAEQAWQKMTAPAEGDETWNQVEEKLTTNASPDKDRRWKFFSK